MERYPKHVSRGVLSVPFYTLVVPNERNVLRTKRHVAGALIRGASSCSEIFVDASAVFLRTRPTQGQPLCDL